MLAMHAIRVRFPVTAPTRSFMPCFYRGRIVEGCSRYSSSLIEKEHDIWDKWDHRNHDFNDGEPIGDSIEGENKMVYEVNISGPTMGQSSDAVQDTTGNLTVNTINTSSSFYVGTGTVTTWPYYNTTWTYTNTVYLYQVRCPRKGCRRYNWLELDKITPCSNCGSELKAVSKVADFEIEVG